MKSGVLSGCNDYGLVTLTILRSLGFPTVFVQSARLDWIKEVINKNENSRRVRGHIFLEVKVEGKWLLFDSTAGIIYLKYDKNNFSLPKEYYVFSKSLDGWETGCINLCENNKIMLNLFKDFKLSKYQSPIYDKISLKE